MNLLQNFYDRVEKLLGKSAEVLKKRSNVVGANENMADPNKLIISADEVLPGVWIGNQAAAESNEWISSNDIKVVINATKHIRFANAVPYHGRVTVYVNDPGPWRSLQHPDVKEMRKSLPSITTSIHAARKKGKNVLVHCHAGMQRSAAIMVAYLALYVFGNGYVKFHKLSLVERKHILDHSEAYLREKRPLVFYHGKYMNFRAAVENFLFNL